MARRTRRFGLLRAVFQMAFKGYSGVRELDVFTTREALIKPRREGARMSRVVLHLSDLHFGRISPGLPEALLEAARQIAPDLAVVSGDLTQRATGVEFKQARAFLDQLPYPRIVVPGNHDVPLHNLCLRFVRGLSRFKGHITEDLVPVYQDAEMPSSASIPLALSRGKGAESTAARLKGSARTCARPAPISRESW